MSQTYVRLVDSAVFKCRYGKWYLIDTIKRERERILIDGGGEHVLLFLFVGKSIDETCTNFCLEREELLVFLRGLVSDNVIAWSENIVDSTDKCYDMDPPLDSVNILLTNVCNLRCVHCYVSSGKSMVGELTGDEWIHILDEIRRLGVFELNISGGEATLHHDFIKIAKYITSVPTFNANLNTNGVIMRSDHEEIVAHAFTSVQVSIDNIVPAKHDAFRGRHGSFEHSIATIKRLVARGVETNIGFTLTHDNLDALDGVIKLAEGLGVTALNIGLVANFGRASTNLLVKNIDPESVLDDQFFERMYQKIKELAVRQSSVRIHLPFRVSGDYSTHMFREKHFICDGDNTQILYIMANGNIMPCDKLPIETFSYGNVRQNSVRNIWMSQKMKDFKLMSQRQLPKCGICPHLIICGGACVARAYQNGGSLDFPDWTSCVIAQKLSRDNSTQR